MNEILDAMEALTEGLEAAGQVEAAYCLNAVAMAMHKGTVAALAAYLKNRPDMRGTKN